MDILFIICWLISSFFALLSFIFCMEVVLAYFSKASSSMSCAVTTDASLSASAAILIPAHNEADVITCTLESLIPQLRTQDELVVIADNCTDDTAAIVKQFPVTIIERSDSERKGKGYALNFGMEYLKSKNIDVIIMVDADCILEPGSRDKLVDQVLKEDRPIQSLYLMLNNGHDVSLSQKIAEFTWLIKNKIRPLGLRRLNGPCQLMGTGMAFPAKLLSNVNLASACIVEDMKLGLDLAIAGSAPKFLPDAIVKSYFPQHEEVIEGQRSRWIHGHLEMIFSYAPKLIKYVWVKRDINALLLCLDLVVPPLVLLFIINVILLAFSTFLAIFSNNLIFVLPLLSVLVLLFSVWLAWICEGQKMVSGKELLWGVISKVGTLSVYLHFITDRRRGWNKTSRK